MAKASDYFNPVYFTRFFNDKLKLKKGGGLDGLTPTTFWKHYAKELDDIASRCLNGTYKFSAYKEKLILKGKDNFPRVLSVPSPCCAAAGDFAKGVDCLGWAYNNGIIDY